MVALGILGALAGCVATVRTGIVEPAAVRADLGRVGVRVTASGPVEFTPRVTGDAARDTLRAEVAAAVPPESLAADPAAILLIPLLLLTRGVVEAVSTPSAATVSRARSILEDAHAEMRLPERLRDHLAGFARTELSTPPPVVPSADGVSPELDTILDVQVLPVVLRPVPAAPGGTLGNPQLGLVLSARARLVRVEDERLLATTRAVHRAGPYRLAEWADERGQRFRQASEAGASDLAREIVRRLLWEVPTGDLPPLPRKEKP
jgi:hypothetical protein